jgi:excinuclease ABC subunit B
LREGIDLPEVSLVAIIDADKEGYLRSSTSLIQTIGRAARHINGEVIMYADKITKSMKYAIDETNKRRKIQNEFNKKFGVQPKSIITSIKDITEKLKDKSTEDKDEKYINNLTKVEFRQLIKKLEKEMKSYAKGMEFEKAAMVRDQISDLRKIKIK